MEKGTEDVLSAVCGGGSGGGLWRVLEYYDTRSSSFILRHVSYRYTVQAGKPEGLSIDQNERAMSAKKITQISG